MTETNVADFSELAKDLQAAADNAQTSVMQMLNTYAVEIQAYAQQYAPVLTGKLRANIRIVRSPGKFVIGVDPEEVDYGGYQEYGTKGPYEIVAKNKKALAFTYGGRVVLVKKVHHPGIKAHPYIRPALARVIDELGPAAAKVGVTLIASRNP